MIALSALIAFLTRDIGPFADAGADCAWFWVSLGVASAGAIVRVFTSGWAAFGTSGRAKVAAEASELNTTGPYSLVRNPLYVGRILNFTGLAMLSGSWVFGALVFLLAVLVYERISVYEEEFLRGKFGEAHAEWAARSAGAAAAPARLGATQISLLVEAHDLAGTEQAVPAGNDGVRHLVCAHRL